ncbi:MAG: DUF2271 domain-containing protein [Flavobacteriaceae bacterium]|nr:DUF2271 domain-containing protein [Flavobacteriaceae bacterium]
MKKLFATLLLSTALGMPALGAANAAQVNLSTNLNNYRGPGAYLAYYVTDANGRYVGSLWLAGSRSRYYSHLTGWYRATGGNPSEINGITGASVGSGRSLKLSFDLADSLFDAGYTLHVDAVAEDMRSSPDDIVVPLTRAGAGKPVKGRSYIADLTYSM